MKNTNALSNKQKAWAYDMWCQGHALWQIADALNVCEKTESEGEE